MPATIGTTTSGSAHPTRGCSMSASVGPASPSAHSAAPTKSTRGRSPMRGAASGMRDDMISVTTTNGTFTAKIARHDQRVDELRRRRAGR